MGTETIEEIVERETTKELAVCDFCGRDSEEVDEMNDLKVNPVLMQYRQGSAKLMRKEVKNNKLVINQLQQNPESCMYLSSDSDLHLCGNCFPAFGDAL